MKIFKKKIIFVLLLILVFSLASCNKAGNGDSYYSDEEIIQIIKVPSDNNSQSENSEASVDQSVSGGTHTGAVSENRETVSSDDDTPPNNSETDANITIDKPSVALPATPDKQEPDTNGNSSQGSSSQTVPTKPQIDYKEEEWRLHPEDFKLLCLTFDDGSAYPSYNEDDPAVKIAKIIKQYHGSATYFYTGKAVRATQGTLQWLINEGFEIANHSDTHVSFANNPSVTTCKQEILNVNEVLKPYGITPKYFRSPGFSTSSNLESILRELQLPNIGYQIPISDWSGGSATKESIKNSLLTRASDGAIVAMHSTNKTNVTPDALAEALPILYEQGYRFCSVDELFTLRNVTNIPCGKPIKRVEPDGRVVAY